MYSFDRDAILGINPDGTAQVDLRRVLQSPIYNPNTPSMSVGFPGMVPPPTEKPPIPPRSDMSINAPMNPNYQDFDAQRAADPRNQMPMGEDQAAGPQPNPVAAQDTVGEETKTQELQPGNRRSIKEYLSQIRALREQQRAMGVPEDQLPVPTFTNIQGGQMDKSQGMLETGPGGMGEQQVRSYVQPEWKANADPNQVPTEMGQSHPIQQMLTQVKAQSPTIQKIMSSGALQNDMDPRWSMAVAFDTIDDWAKMYYDQNGKYPTAKEASDTFHRLRSQAFKAQGENIAKYQKMFPGKDQEDFWKAFRTGNWADISKKGNDMLSEKKFGEIIDEARKRWDTMRDKDNAAPLDDDGNPFPSQEEYVQYKVDQYKTMITNMLKAAQGNQATGPQTGQKQENGSTGGPQTGGRSYAPPKGVTVVNEGTMPDGRRVKQYSDGSIVDQNGNRIK